MSQTRILIRTQISPNINRQIVIFILQWNINGLYTHLEKLKLLLSQYQCKIFCLQETNFKETNTYSLKGFSAFHHIRETANRASGGVAIYGSENYVADQIPLTTHYEAVAVSIRAPIKFSICNIYLPNSHDIHSDDLDALIKQIPPPRIIMGDFNAYNTIWGSVHDDRRGRIMEEFINRNNFVLLNTGAVTRFSTSTFGYRSHFHRSNSSATLYLGHNGLPFW